MASLGVFTIESTSLPKLVFNTISRPNRLPYSSQKKEVNFRVVLRRYRLHAGRSVYVGNSGKFLPMFGANVRSHDHVRHFKALRHLKPILDLLEGDGGRKGRKASRIFTMALILSRIAGCPGSARMLR